MTTISRFGVVDALRGVAISGILFVNIPDMVHLGYGLEPGTALRGREVLYFLVGTRFVPIFTLLFGMSLVFVLQGARSRGRRAWLALLLRLVALAGIGALHGLVYPGEVLLEYAVVGLVLLPLVLFSPRWLQLSLGLASVVAVYAYIGGGALSTPPLMLTGAALAAYGLPKLLEETARPIRRGFAVASVLLVPVLWWQTTQPGDPASPSLAAPPVSSWPSGTSAVSPWCGRPVPDAASLRCSTRSVGWP